MLEEEEAKEGGTSLGIRLPKRRLRRCIPPTAGAGLPLTRLLIHVNDVVDEIHDYKTETRRDRGWGCGARE